MADIIIVRRTCSTCDAVEDSTTNEFANIVGVTINVDNQAGALLHVCKQCMDNVFTGLMEIGTPISVKPAKGVKKRGTGEHICEFCGRDDFVNKQGLGKHKNAAHKDQVHLQVTPATRRRRTAS